MATKTKTRTIDKLVDAALRTMPHPIGGRNRRTEGTPMQPTSDAQVPARIVNEASSTRGARSPGSVVLAVAVLFWAGGCTAVGPGMCTPVGSKYAKCGLGVTRKAPD